MTNAYIKGVSGGETTSPVGTEAIELDNGSDSTWIQILNLVTRKLRETSGPTVLSMGAVSDGQYLTRSGSNIIGAALTAGLPSGHLYRLTLSNNGTDANNDIDIAAGECRDDTDAVDIEIASAITKRLDAAWAVGTNQGGLDTGSIADTTYHVWIIKRSDTGVVDVLFSTSATAPTMPTNYDYKRRIGSIVRTGAAIKAFVQDGDDFRWASPVLDVNSTNPGTSAVTRTLTVPLGIRVKALIALRGEGTSAAANPNGILISDLSVADIAPAGKFNIYIYTGLAGTTNGTGVVEVWTNTSGQVRSRLEVSAAGTTILMVTHGWMDRRGRLG